MYLFLEGEVPEGARLTDYVDFTSLPKNVYVVVWGENGKLAEEIEGKSRVHWQTWREAYDEILPADFQEQMTLDKCRFYSQKYPENTLIALDDAKVVGFVSYGDFRDSATIAGEIFALYVLKDYYGKGVGQQLIQAAFAALDGYQEIILWVLEDNKRAIAFYEKMGFVFDGQEKVMT